MREACNLTYAFLADGRDRVQLAELDAALASPEEKQKVYDKVNAESMAKLGIAPLMPPVKKSNA